MDADVFVEIRDLKLRVGQLEKINQMMLDHLEHQAEAMKEIVEDIGEFKRNMILHTHGDIFEDADKNK